MRGRERNRLHTFDGTLHAGAGTVLESEHFDKILNSVFAWKVTTHVQIGRIFVMTNQSKQTKQNTVFPEIRVNIVAIIGNNDRAHFTKNKTTFKKTN
jgi:hypothetical protein